MNLALSARDRDPVGTFSLNSIGETGISGIPHKKKLDLSCGVVIIL